MAKAKSELGLQRVKILTLNRTWLRPRLSDQSTLLSIQGSVNEFGLLTLPTVSLKTKILLSLYGVTEAMLTLGEVEMDVWVVDLTPEQELAAYFALNNHGNDWDWQKVSDRLKELQKASMALAATGFGNAKTKALTHCGDWVPPEPAKLDGEQAKQVDFTF